MNGESRPLYIRFSSIEQAENFKIWIYKCKALMKKVGWTRDQLYNMTVSNKRSQETVRNCNDMQQYFATISSKIDLFDHVAGEVDPNSYNVVLKLRFKEEISNRMQIRRWAHLTHINADRLIPLPSHYTQEKFLETLRSVNIRYDKIRFARRGSLTDANKETLGTRSNKTYMGPPLLLHIGTAATTGTTTTARKAAALVAA